MTMAETPLTDTAELRRERANRVRIGATGLAAIVVIVLLAVSFSGTASNEPELTPEAIAEQAAAGDPEADAVDEPPQEPLAELGVAPGTGRPEGVTTPPPATVPAAPPAE